MPATMLHFIQQCLSKYWSYAARRESFIKRNVSGKKSTRKYNGRNFSWTMEAHIIRDEKVKIYQEIILQKDKFHTFNWDPLKRISLYDPSSNQKLFRL
jgi:hypothetical protein